MRTSFTEIRKYLEEISLSNWDLKLQRDGKLVEEEGRTKEQQEDGDYLFLEFFTCYDSSMIKPLNPK